ncbi:matrilin-3-like [Branchiostoma floridae x Branchiostoma japonicum]
MKLCATVLLVAAATLPLVACWLYDEDVDCVLTEWSDWIAVPGGLVRTRDVLRYPQGNGLPCGDLEEFDMTGAMPTVEQTTANLEENFLGNNPVARAAGNKRDLVLLLDMSGSIGAADFSSLKTDVAELLSYICPVGGMGSFHRVAVVTFSNSVVLNFNFHEATSLGQIQAKIYNLPYEGSGTRTADAINFVRTQVFQTGNYRDAPDVDLEVLLITDGHPNGAGNSPQDVELAAGELSVNGVYIYALGYGSAYSGASDFDHLKNLVTAPWYKHIFNLEHVSDFETMLYTLANRPSEIVCVNFQQG